MMDSNQKNIFQTSMVYFVLLLLFLGIRVLSAFNLFAFLGESGGYVLSAVIQIGIMLLVPLLLFSLLKKQKVGTTLKEFGIKKIGINAVLISISLGFLVFFLNIGVSSFFNFLIRFLGFDPRGGSVVSEYPVWLLFVNLTFTALLPGICEEVAHRGMLLHGYRKMGIKKAMILSSLLFGLMHLNIEQFFYATIIGLIIAEFAVVSGSIIPGMIVHFMNNALSIFATFAYVNKLSFGNINLFLESLASGNFFVSILLLTTILFMTVYALAHLTNRLYRETTLKHFCMEQRSVSDSILKETYLKDVERTRKSILGEEVEPESKIIDEMNEKLKKGKDRLINLRSQIYPFKQTVWPEKFGRLFLTASIVLGCTVTLFTFLWGVI